MIKLSRLIVVIVGLSILISACADKELIDKQTMANAYVDILIVKEKYQSNSDSLTVNQKNIFKKYGITEKEYEATLKSFKFDKDVWTDFFKTVYSRIDSLKSKKERLAKKHIHVEKNK